MSLIAAEGLHVSFNGRAALDGAALTVERGETVGLLGPNAAGKTTLLRALGGRDFSRPDALQDIRALKRKKT